VRLGRAAEALGHLLRDLGASGDSSSSTSSARTRGSGISAASNARAMRVGAIGENLSISRAARKCARTCWNRASGSRASSGAVTRAGASASTSWPAVT